MPRLAAPEAKERRRPRKDPNAQGDLSRYRSMRDFAKTPEPSGAIAVPGEGLRFVVQKHAARRLHYDLRLELNGVFKSWAVAKGPSLDPEVKRLAIQVEDHPIDYGDFEGIIPKGEYGGGTVMIWDRGFWRPEGDPAKGYEKGHLAFELDGEKLKGRWHLIRTKLKSSRNNEQWLFFKSGDEYARPSSDGDILEEAPSSAASHRSIEEIAHGEPAVWSSAAGGLTHGDLSPADDPPARRPARVDAGSIAGAEKAPFPGFIEPCLAQLAMRPPEGEAWLHEIKFDGYRLIAMKHNGRVQLMTRSGLDWTGRFQGIAAAFKNIPAQSVIADGEVVVEDENGVSSFQALQEALPEGPGAAPPVLYAFDLLYLDGFDLRKATLDRRKEALARLLAGTASPSLRFSEHMIAEGAAMFEHACRLGLEGIVSKRRSQPYRSGRHGDWVKCKCTHREEFVIGGYVPSTASRGAVGSLALGYFENGKLIYVGRAGTGFTQKSAQRLHERLQKLRTTQQPFANALSTAERRGLLFAEPLLVCEAEFRGWTHDRRLRQAAFKGLREDKPASEVRLELPNLEAQSDPSPEKKELRAMKPSTSGTAEFAGVTLTHPDRLLWKAQGISKLGLAQYYAETADYILPHIAGRPLALVRCPDGSDGPCFFQKHSFAGLTDAVEIVRAGKTQGEEEAIVINDLRGLITLVQASVLEIHPWGARIEDLERPDRLIFDLDPAPDVEWNAVIEGANEVRRRLKDAGIKSYVKTSGGKGLHIVSPLTPSAGWNELKEFARSIALAMEADEPSRYVAAMAKKARRGKIFVDYLRNARGATAVAPYSTRAKPGAPVSTPVRWDELGPELVSTRFNAANLGRRLARLKSDPWEGFLTEPQSIGKASAQR